MQAALDNLVPEIVDDCGGSCSCATCHAYADANWIGRLPTQSENEKLMLEGAFNVEADSRLTCQIAMTAELDGLVVRTPPSQF